MFPRIRLLLWSTAAWPLTARAQQPTMPLIGFLSSRSPGESASVVAAFRQGLCEAGSVEGRNLAIAFRWADGRYDSLPARAAELVDLPVTLIFAAGRPPTAFAVPLRIMHWINAAAIFSMIGSGWRIYNDDVLFG